MNRTAYKTKRNQITCRCAAYAFPHRLDSKACRELYNSTQEATEYVADSVSSLGLSSLFAVPNPVIYS